MDLSNVLKPEAGEDVKVFAISMFTWKPTIPEVQHMVFLTFGGTLEEAHAAGLEEARRLWPESDGWQDHHTQVQPIEIQLKPEAMSMAIGEVKQDFVM